MIEDGWTWFKSNFDKLLLLLLFMGLVVLVLHMSHDKLDEEQVSWAREMTGTVLGGLLGLVTGTRIGLAMRPSTEPEEKK